MLKLIKYELRRWLSVKILIVSSLLALVATFFGCYAWKNEMGISITLAFMSLVTVVILFYAPLECLLLFDKDRNTRQGYMLFLLPKRAVAILGAKLLASVLQSTVLYALFFSVVPFCEKLATERYGPGYAFVSLIRDAFISFDMDAGEIVETISVLLLLWLFLACLEFFISTILGKGKLASIFGAVLYFAATVLVFFVLEKGGMLLDYVKAPELLKDTLEYVYMFGIDLALFFGTARLLEKKVSI